MTEPLDVLAVFAHPDDAELLSGGALIRSVDAGERVGVLDLSRGETGTRGSAGQRAREAERAAEVMGLVTRRNAGLPDGGIQNGPEERRTVAALIRELRPRVVVTHWIRSRHPDHYRTAELVYDASFLAGLTNWDAPGTAFRPHKVVHCTTFREDVAAPTFVVDVTEQMDRKMEALACYGSQFEGRSGAGELFPGGERSFEEQVRARLAAYGSLVRVPYGEPFRTRETMEAGTLGTLRVSTF